MYFFIPWWWYSEMLREPLTRQRPGVRTRRLPCAGTLTPQANSQDMNVSAGYQHNTPESKTLVQGSDQTSPAPMKQRSGESNHQAMAPSTPLPLPPPLPPQVHRCTSTHPDPENWENRRKLQWMRNLPERNSHPKRPISGEKKKNHTWHTIN